MAKTKDDLLPRGSRLARLARRFWRDWSLRRQLQGQDPSREAAQSEGSRAWTARVEQADRIGTSICPYCAVGCAQLVYARQGKVIQIEGDPRSPINRGTLCPKGAASFDWFSSPQRIDHVMYRAPYADRWETKPLDWAMERIAQLAKATRDRSFVAERKERADDGEESGTPLMHTLRMASLGGATLDNEENYLIKKLFAGGLGMVWIENQARV